MLWGKTVPSILSGGKTEERKSMFIILLVDTVIDCTEQCVRVPASWALSS